MDIITNKFNNMKEEIGLALIPVLTELMDRVIMPLIPFIEQAASSFAAWLPNLLAIAETIASYLTPAFQALSNWWSENGEAIVSTAQAIWSSLVSGAQQAGDILAPFIADILQKLADWWYENGPLVSEFVRQFGEAFNIVVPEIIKVLGALSPLLIGVFDIILELVTLTMQIFTGDWTGAWETAKDIVKTAAQAIWDTLVNLASIIVEELGFESNDIISVWSDNWNQLVQIVERSVGQIATTVSQAGSIISSFMENPIGSYNAVFGGGRALGGSVMAGGAYTVGERGTEMFVPNTSGQIVPNSGMGGGAINITLNYTPSVALGNRQEAENTLLPYILQGIRAAQSNGLLATV
jgi:phage-related protein